MFCMVIAHLTPAEILNLLPKSAMAEIRLDLLDLQLAELRRIFTAHPRLVATCRPGRFNDDARQLLLTEALRNGAAYVDIECDASEAYRQTLQTEASRAKAKVIISYHNYECTPARLALRRILRHCEALTGDLVKLVTYCHERQDQIRLRELYDWNKKPLIAFGMGNFGIESRLTALRRGAPFVYVAAAAEQATAPGQPTATDLLNFKGRESANAG